MFLDIPQEPEDCNYESKINGHRFGYTTHVDTQTSKRFILANSASAKCYRIYPFALLENNLSLTLHT